MTPSLDASQRNLLERLVGRARRLLEEDLAAQASGRYGIDRDGTVAHESTLRLPEADLEARSDLVGVLEHLRSEGQTPAAAVERLIREAVFTQLNRLVTIRIAEDLGLLRPSLAQGTGSAGFREFLELAPLLADDPTGGYLTYLQLCGDELAGDVPNLFDPRNPLLALSPSPAALDMLVSELADENKAHLWAAPDCLGWVYQFFNTGEERRKMREAGAPRDSRELAVRNQFFTPRYVVDFLVQNSLGRRLLDSDPASGLLDDLPLLVDPPQSPTLPLDLAEAAVLDPACGSGHFLLAAYDVLERAWLRAGVQPSDSAANIIGSLYGIDIDPRCCQVAAAALILRARRSSPDVQLPRPNIICARALPAGATGLEEVLSELSPTQQKMVASMTETLNDAPVLGPLLQVEARLSGEARAASFAGIPTSSGSFADAVPSEDLKKLETDTLATLQQIADTTTATPAERLLATEADDALRFVYALLRRYDAVLMNPPFGDPVSSTKPYLKAAYPWIPTNDLFAAFVGRGLELCASGGYVGAITPRSGMFLKTFEKWRQHAMADNKLVVLADLGYGVMEQALVEAAAYVVEAERPGPEHRPRFIRLLKDTNRPAGLRDAIKAARANKADPRLYQVPLTELTSVPGAPIAYWMSPSIRRLFSDYPPLEGHGAQVRQGLATGDDFRFVRAFWEVDPARIARSREETKQGKRWVPFAKGGEYSPYWADIHLVVDWENDGERIRGYPGARPQNTQYFFRPGLTWPERTTSDFGPRVLPRGCIFSHVGYALFPFEEPASMLAYMNSRLARSLMAALTSAGEGTTSGTAARHYLVSLVQGLPWPPELGKKLALLMGSRAAIDLQRNYEADTDETSRAFLLSLNKRGDYVAEAQNRYFKHLRDVSVALDLITAADIAVSEATGLDATALSQLDDEALPLPGKYRFRRLSNDEEKILEFMLSEGINEVVDYATAKMSGHRSIATKSFFVERRLELCSHILQLHPLEIVKRIDDLHIKLPAIDQQAAEVLVSYLVGTAFGRWDIRKGRDSSLAPALPDPFGPVPVCPPGMLVWNDGLPAKNAPEGYPLELPPQHLLLDQPGHRWDIEARIVAATGVLFDNSDKIINDLLRILGSHTIREHLRKRFFKEHLSRYSKSRRKAPIYWPLYVPSGKWGVWVYAPRLSRETLFAVESAAAARLEAAGTEIRQLQREREWGGSGRTVREVANALEAEEALVEELKIFRQGAQKVAGLGWDPDLGDGIVLCAAPLADLFPAWKDAAAERENLRSGKYPWASVSKWADRM